MQNNQLTLTTLHRRWWGVVLLYAGSLWLGYQLLRLTWPEALVQQWVIQAAVVLAYGLGVCRTGLAQNHRPGESSLLPTFGVGNTVSLLRGLVMGLLAGFVFLPRPMDGLLAWMPAMLYTVLAILDYLDGYLARITGQATVLGARLDGAFDALGLLVAVGLAVWYGQLPGWYLLIGLSRYLFSFGSWWRKRQGKSVYDLPPSSNRRVLAGFQMGFISVILWPLFSPPGTTLAGVIFAIPFLAGFGRDWLVVSGRLDPSSTAYATARQKIIQLTTGWLPLLLRVMVVIVSVQFLWPIALEASLRRTFLAWPGAFLPNLTADGLGVLAMLATVMLGLGVLGRLAALALLAPTAMTVLALGLNLQNSLLVAGTIAIMLLGSGNFSLWQPEELLVRVRAGEKKTVS
jgi:CDP-diacylglycerol--glycerol-3-phosphate 3-phosphatidyltransferase